MNRGSFFIQCNKNHFELRQGWLNGTWGYCKDKSGWIATDLESGLAFNCYGYATRAMLIEAIERDAEKLSAARESTYYAGMVVSFRRGIAEYNQSEKLASCAS